MKHFIHIRSSYDSCALYIDGIKTVEGYSLNIRDVINTLCEVFIIDTTVSDDYVFDEEDEIRFNTLKYFPEHL